MERRDLVAKLAKTECVLLRSGGKPDIYHDPKGRLSDQSHGTGDKQVAREEDCEIPHGVSKKEAQSVA
jgi:hypothetical protein